MKARFYGYGILVLGLMSLLASCKAPTSSPSKAWVVSTLAGSGSAGKANGNGTAAQFNFPRGVAVDSSGNVYVADDSNHRIRKISTGGEVSTLAGSGEAGDDNGIGTAAQFNHPRGVAVDSGGNVYVADAINHRIRKITAEGEVSTLAGSTRGFANGKGTAAQFTSPSGVAVDSNGIVYVGDSVNNRIRKITTVGVVSTPAGSSTKGFLDSNGAAAQFSYPFGVAVDSNGIVYVADQDNHRIRKITINSSGVGVVTTLAGSTEGFKDGSGTEARFNNPTGVAVDSNGIIYVADESNHRIRKITINSSGVGVVTTLAGSGEAGDDNGAGTAAQFNNPIGVAVDSSGIVYVGDMYNHRIRKIEYRVP